jgi:error-prone DNA polymerase
MAALLEEGPAPRFAPLDAFQAIAWDRLASHHSARGHPLGPLRAELRRQGLPDARQVWQIPHGRRVRYAGLVINRQRPGTAKGVVFMTLEDETGFVNLVLWDQVFRDHWVLAKTASFLGVTGRVQSDEGVVHVIVEQLWEPQVRRAPNPERSRDFQ